MKDLDNAIQQQLRLPGAVDRFKLCADAADLTPGPRTREGERTGRGLIDSGSGHWWRDQ